MDVSRSGPVAADNIYNAPPRSANRAVRGGGHSHTSQPIFQDTVVTRRTPECSARRGYRALHAPGPLPRRGGFSFAPRPQERFQTAARRLERAAATARDPMAAARLRREHVKSSPPARHRVLCPAWPDRRRNPGCNFYTRSKLHARRSPCMPRERADAGYARFLASAFTSASVKTATSRMPASFAARSFALRSPLMPCVSIGIAPASVVKWSVTI